MRATLLADGAMVESAAAKFALSHGVIATAAANDELGKERSSAAASEFCASQRPPPPFAATTPPPTPPPPPPPLDTLPFDCAVGDVAPLLVVLVFIIVLYSLIRTFLPSTMQVRFGRGLKTVGWRGASAKVGRSPVSILGILLHVLLGEARLFLVERLLLGVRHRFPSRA